MAEEFVAKHRSKLRGIATLAGVNRTLATDLGRARQSFNDRVSSERRGEQLFDKALQSALEYAESSPPKKGIAPKVVDTISSERAAPDASYRESPPEEEITLKPSRLLPPPSPLARMRNRLLFGAAWTVVVIRFATAVRSHGPTQLALMQGLLGTLAILPIVLGVLLLILPKR
jgi:hypothetical protein